jgi:hypothetical protein
VLCFCFMVSIFTNSIEAYNNPIMHIFAGIFVSWILITFGQFVPSWIDSAYYQLMMTQNIPYKGYLSSKWWLMVINYRNYWLHPFIFILDGVFNHCRWRYLQYWCQLAISAFRRCIY